MPTETQAWREAVATADAAQVLLVTVEIHHPAIIEGGTQAAVRVVQDTQDFIGRLESTAPLNAGQDVTFTAFPFEIEMPQMGEDGAWEAKIKIDNIGREVSQHIDAAVGTNAEMQVILRCYLASAPTVVARGPFRFVMHECEEVAQSLEGKIMVADPANQKAFREVYDMVRFPALMAIS